MNKAVTVELEERRRARACAYATGGDGIAVLVTAGLASGSL
jgi:hypothetical protein